LREIQVLAADPLTVGIVFQEIRKAGAIPDVEFNLASTR
jgi:hypothetical protein